jgi:putative membrane protein
MAHAVPGPAAVPPLGPEGFDWTTWQSHPSVVIGLGVLGAAYLAASLWRRRLDPDATVESLKAVSFTGALLVLLGALTGPLHDLSDDYLFSAHMIQHMLLVFAVPPLLLYGTPGWMLRPILRDPGWLRVGRALTRPTGAFATFNVVLVAWHLPPLYNLAMERHPVHIVEHLMILAAAVILWWPVLSPLTELPRAAYPIQLLYLFVAGLPMVMVAIFIAMAEEILYPFYSTSPRIWPWLTPRVDQHLGGLIMWIPGGFVFLLAIAVVFFRWQAAGGDDVALPVVEAPRGG